MGVTSGFYNSMNGDRKYTSEQMSAIFDGVITEGIFANIGECFKVKANNTDNEITVGTGKAWFNSKWILNDAPYKINMDYSDNIADRIDAIVIEINLNVGGREAKIKAIKGSPSNTPEKPVMLHSNGIFQYPIAYILRKSESTKITGNDIDNIVGTAERPYVADLLEPNKAMYIYENTAEDVDNDNFYKKMLSYHKPIRFTEKGNDITVKKGTYTIIPFDTLYPYDNPIASYANNEFVIEEDGIYRIVVNALIHSSVTNNAMLSLKISDGSVSGYADSTIGHLDSNENKALNINTIRNIKKGTKVAIACSSNSGDATVSGSSGTFGYIEKIGEYIE